MIYTSYFAKIRDIPKHIKKVSISQFTPYWAKINEKAKELAPSKDLLFKYKKNEITNKEYREIYSRQVHQFQKEHFKKFNNKVLLCYEKRGDFCHRHILRGYMKYLGIESKEFNYNIRDKLLLNVGIIGSRDFEDIDLLNKYLNIITEHFDIKIISGGARGADKLGEEYADKNNIPKIIFKPDWDKYGKIAGFIRNDEIIKNSELIVAFWDGSSRGTEDSINKAYKYKKPIIIINYIKNKVKIDNFDNCRFSLLNLIKYFKFKN